ncbi:MAG: hypothetical protein JAZ18_01825 [Candidatus Thiodiazotropha endolucinida]|nr:hypothetical protein [Candidatus Thiodiazotropha endolucinida]
MKLITRFELAAKETHELHTLFRELFNRVASNKLNAQDRVNAIASMQNIQNELIYRSIP